MYLSIPSTSKRFMLKWPWPFCAGLLVLMLVACVGPPQVTPAPAKEAMPATAPTAVAIPPTPAAAATPPPPAATPAPLKLLKTVPETGPVGTNITVTGDGLLPGKAAEIIWVTADGSYETKFLATDVQFRGRKFAEKRVPLSTAVVDAQGRVSATFTIPEDFGEVHDIYVVVDGQEVAKGGFRIVRNATISPNSGPVGTPITIIVKGIAIGPWTNTMAIRYDNAYTGFVSAVTTKGTAAFKIRASGTVGQHFIQLTGASPGLPFLNLQQSGAKHVPNMDWKFAFTVTEGSPLPPPTVDWPAPSRVAAFGDLVPKIKVAPGITAKLDPAFGPVLTEVTLRASGLSPNTGVELFWITGRGSDSQGVRFLAEVPLIKATSTADGSLTARFQVTDDRGGWQTVKVVQGDKVLAEIPFYAERSLVGTGVTPQRVKAGETFTVNIKGGGWTEIDKGFAITYDNAYIGYACTVTSSGDLTVYLVATGKPGVHLIDLYPMIYRQPADHPPDFWNFQLPQLTALEDHPSLALGYKLPIIRLAIEVVE